MLNRIKVFSEFELLFSQSVKHVLTSAENVGHLKVYLNEIAYDFVNLSIDSRAFLWQQNHYWMARLLRSRTDIYITKPYKGSDYINKMSSILDVTSKFQKLGEASFDDTENGS